MALWERVDNDDILTLTDSAQGGCLCSLGPLGSFPAAVALGGLEVKGHLCQERMLSLFYLYIGNVVILTAASIM